MRDLMTSSGYVASVAPSLASADSENASRAVSRRGAAAAAAAAAACRAASAACAGLMWELRAAAAEAAAKRCSRRHPSSLAVSHSYSMYCSVGLTTITSAGASPFQKAVGPSSRYRSMEICTALFFRCSASLLFCSACICVATIHMGLVASTLTAPAHAATTSDPATPMSSVRLSPLLRAAWPPPLLPARLARWCATTACLMAE
mmetsp:Transcript_27716/g.70634  ORF Transcript_27716/g.70634 Transcript_27716/m.70634 type:complete len:204 (-) Transcript_27716:384-995(-)